MSSHMAIAKQAIGNAHIRHAMNPTELLQHEPPFDDQPQHEPRSQLCINFSGAAQGLQSVDRHSSRLGSAEHHHFFGAMIAVRGMQ